MNIYSVFDPEFKPYGHVVDGMEETVQEILDVLKDAPQGAGVDYVPEYEPLQELHAMVEISEHCYGGMPVQLGWCNGHNTKLNCLEYHRDSEFNLGTEDKAGRDRGRCAGHRQGQGFQGSCRGAGGGLCHHPALRSLPLRCK